jgi:hypothetical protein
MFMNCSGKGMLSHHGEGGGNMALRIKRSKTVSPLTTTHTHNV